MPTRFLSWVAPLLTVTGLCALITGATCYFMQPDRPALVVQQTALEIHDSVQGEVRDLALPVYNRSNRPVRMVGWTYC